MKNRRTRHDVRADGHLGLTTGASIIDFVGDVSRSVDDSADDTKIADDILGPDGCYVTCALHYREIHVTSFQILCGLQPERQFCVPRLEKLD